jgi:DMSO/TMAO reductase YedYZ heme-binding membrane subunit
MKIDRFTKSVVLLNCLVPATLLGWDALRGNLGANPVNFAIRTTGMLALIFLVLSLAVTPASKLTGYGWLAHFRRMLGLNAFFHATLHFLLFFALDRSASIESTASEILLRPYLMVGAFGLVLMAPLAATSTNAMIKRLGTRRWKALHRLAYLAAVAGALHFYMLVKADVTWPYAFASALGVLFLYRLVSYYLQRRTYARKFGRASPATSSARSKP